MQPRSPESTDSTQQYLNEIGQYDLLTAEQEVELGRQIIQGKNASTRLADLNGEIDDVERQKLAELAQLGLEAKRKFIESNLRLVVSVAKTQQHKAKLNDLLDLIQEGNEGLIRAVEKFDYRKGFKFSTYAIWWIRQAVFKSIAKTNYSTGISRRDYDMLSLYGNTVKDLSHTRSGPPSVEDIAEESGLELEQVKDLKVIYETQTNLISLDMPVGEHSKTAEVNDFVPDDNHNAGSEALDRVESEELVSLITEILTERDADIILRLNGFLGELATLTELGKKHGLTREAVRKIEKTALGVIALEMHGPSFEEAGKVC